MALDFLTGNETPTAARMNLLWDEAETIIDKAMDGKSTYLLFNGAVDSSWVDYLHTGKEFWFYTASQHQSDDLSVLYPIYSSLPATHDQATIDSAVSGATYTYDSGGWALSATDIAIDQTLKAHTVTDSGNTYYVWDKGQPAPEKRWKYAVAEILIGNASGNVFEFPDTYDKYNAFKLHNLTGSQITFYFGTSSSYNYSLTIPAYSQKCVRRDSVTAGYDSSYKYFFKCKKNDPRFLAFDSHTGSVAQTMRANNITNASYLYNIMEFVGQHDLVQESVRQTHRITFEPTQCVDIGGEYATAGYVPTVNDSAKVAELAFHTGDLSYYRATDATSTPEIGTIEFDGYSNLATALTTAGLGSSTVLNKFTITKSASKLYYYVWQKTTNLLTYQDQFRTLDLGSGSSDVALETKFYMPPVFTHPQYLHNYQYRGNDSSSYAAHTKTVGTLKTDLTTHLNSTPTLSSKEVKLTTEGPILFWHEAWPVNNWFTGFMRSHYTSINLSGGTAYVELDQDWPVATNKTWPSLKTSEYRAGWPSMWKGSVFNGTTGGRRHSTDAHKFHRLFEGPRKPRLYETTSGNYPHLEINNDPAGPNGVDFTQNKTGTLTTTGIAHQTNDIDIGVEAFSAGDTDVPNYPRTVIADGAKNLEDTNSTSATAAEIVSAVFGNPTEYCRLNLLKEHYNDLVNVCKAATKIRPLCIDEVYFGNKRPMAQGSYLFNNYLAPRECYAGFTDGSSEEDLYNNLGVTIRDETDAPMVDVYADALTGDDTTMEAWHWVKIADVQSRATALGFKFRLEEQVIPMRYSTTATRFFATTAVDASCEWKFRAAAGVISGSTYINTLTQNNYTIGLHYTGSTTTTDANRAILFHLYDDSRTASGNRADFAESEIGNSDGATFGSDAIQDLTADVNFVTPTETTKHYLHFCQVNPPVTHTA